MSDTIAKTFVSPTGARITGSLERLSGVARIDGFEANGEPIYSGETEIWWDEQRTVIRDDEHVYVDANGEEWLQSQLVESGNWMPPAVRAAFEEVRQWHPEITAVCYDADLRWTFTDSHGDAPEFSEQVDVEILEDAADAVATLDPEFPAYFNWNEREGGAE